MPGGKGNIKPEDGKQFSSDYQPEEKWTEENALNLGNELIEWLKKPSKGNIFFEEFLYINENYYPELIAYLSKKFTSFLNLLDRAKNIQKIKLIKYGVSDLLNAPMTKFTLINNHNMSDKQVIENPVSNKIALLKELPPKERAKRIKELVKELKL